MIRAFTERNYQIDFNTLPAGNKIFSSNKGYLPFPFQLVISQKRWQQQYITNSTAYSFLSILLVTFFARNVNKIAHFQGEVDFFVWLFLRVFFRGFFHGNRNSTEKVFFFATTVKLNSQNNCVKNIPIRRYKEKLLREKIPFLVLRKILLNAMDFLSSGIWKHVNSMVFQTVKNSLIFLGS